MLSVFPEKEARNQVPAEDKEKVDPQPSRTYDGTSNEFRGVPPIKRGVVEMGDQLVDADISLSPTIEVMDHHDENGDCPQNIELDDSHESDFPARARLIRRIRYQESLKGESLEGTFREPEGAFTFQAVE
jgi:hypothetical protein